MSTPDLPDLPNASVKIKQEKLDPEIERKLNPNLLLPDSTNIPEGDTPVEEKKNIEPVKSSNEILAELFMVFNATPPEELLSNTKLTKKAKKEHKKSKHKKKKKKKHKSAENSGGSDDESGESDNKKKKHKHKRKKSSKEKSVDAKDDSDKKSAATAGTVIMAADSSSSSKLKTKIKEEPIDSVDVKVEKTSSSKSESRSRVERRLRNCSRVEEGSDISLSDEETYLKEKNRYKEMDTAPSKRPKYDHHRNAFYRNSSNSYYSSERTDRSYNRHHHRSRSRTKTHSRSRSRSKSAPRDLGIDKKRLLEIARKNAITMFKSGSLPGCASMTEEVKDKVLMKMRYGGKTVQDLTNFCKKLTQGENYDDLSEFSSEEDSDVDKQGNAKAFHHPFVLKDRDPIVMHIRNATQIAPKTADQKKAITMQFPVSSGQQHRLTEGWVPVPAKEPEVPTPVIVKPAVEKPLGFPKNVFQKQLPIEEQQPAFKPLGVPAATAEAEVALPDAVPIIPALPSIVPPPPPPAPPAVEAPTIFPPAAPSMDVSTIISQRLSAMRRLQENPMDCEAIKMMYTSQKEMTSWASSKHMPGQFTGSTGANILSARELTSGSQAWARKDQLTSTVPVSGGMGMHLLKKMGWKPGEGLGREKTGSLQPLLLDVKLDKRGLVADEEVNGNHPPRQNQGPPSKRKKNNTNPVAQARLNIDNKHPVCLLNELSTKRKWTPPTYQLVTDEGPSHNKFFVFSVNVNGQIFNPGIGGNTKKEAKMLSAKFCLQQMGVLS